MKTGGVSLDAFESDRALLSSRELWWKALKQLHAGMMPPADRPQPNAEQKERIIAWIKDAVFEIDPANPDPGRVTVRRLNRVEYRNTIRDLLGVATNIIPDQVTVEGTFRTLDETWRARAKELIEKIAKGTAEAMGGSCEVNIMHGFPYLENNPGLTERTRASAEEYLGKENVLDLDLWMAAEDFAFYSQKVDACFYRLGVRNEARGITSPVHTPTFDIDENALEVGAGLMAWLAFRELRE
jgi:acetylornithine deacetylase/succinyl-diaminopimelate desuccinylase-like protein